MTRMERRKVWPLLNWIALTVVLVGTSLAYLGLQRIVTPKPTVLNLQTPVHLVAPGVSIDATATNSIGQQHVVRTSDGYLVSLFGSPTGLSVVSDLGDHGRSWRAPVTIPAIQASSLSAAIDADDRVHLAFTNEEGPAFAVLNRDAGGWHSSNIVQLDTGTSPILDVAWDAERGLAHVVWIGAGDSGEVIRWASFASGDVVEMEDKETLAGPIAGSSLANIAAGPAGQVIITYRKGDEAGWYSRSFVDDGAGWQPEETLPIKVEARAGSVAMDRRGVAHLVLIDGAGEEMIYLKRSNKGWLTPETVVAPATTEEMGEPFLAVDTTSKLLYAFFSTTGTADALRVVVNDPAVGWEDPYRISADDNSTQGHSPTSMDPLVGNPLVLWTGSGTEPSVHSGNIVVP